ncbi:hypothetical protein ACQR16_01890 [Bradyrhizobium oligotrophicum]|uniref:hypothetical protein n=1 Tax=Bradyrhizobium oligotrophicum TaxID=44255 RepID=UPI003EC14433
MPGDQIAGDDEEDIDAGKATTKTANSQVEQNDNADCDRPEAIDVRPITTLQLRPPHACLRRTIWTDMNGSNQKQS